MPKNKTSTRWNRRDNNASPDQYPVFMGTQTSLKTAVLLVTPDMATNWLQTGAKNRNISARQVEKLTNQMREGKWSLDGQTIKFSSKGDLLDGQHRLHAVIQSGIPTRMLVVTGIHDPMAFGTIDTNIAVRGAHTLLQMDGILNATATAAIARRLLHWENTFTKTKFSFGGVAWERIAPADVHGYVINHVNEIQEISRTIQQSLPCRKCKARASFVTALILCNRADSATTATFVEGLKTGIGLAGKSPIALLRDRLIDPPIRRELSWETEIMALTIKAWNHFHAGKPLTVLRWRTQGAIPEAFPVPKVLR